MPGMSPATETAAHFQLKTYAIEPIALPRKPCTSQGRRDPDRAPQQPQSPDMHAKSSTFQSPRLKQQRRRETHARSPSVSPFSPSSSSKTTTAHWNASRSLELEPVDFDPFESSESFGILIQDPAGNAAQRQDPANLHVFRQWLSDNFPKVLHTLRSLKLLHDRSRHDQHRNQRPGGGDGDHTNRITTNTSDSQSWVNEVDGHPDSDDERGSNLDEQHQHSEITIRSAAKLAMRAANLEAWQTFFRHVTLQVLAPNDHLVVQDATRTGSVYFVLNGSCELKSQPKFLEFLLAKRKKTGSATSQAQQQQQPETSQSSPRPGATSKKKSKTKTKKAQQSTSLPGAAQSLHRSSLGPRKLSLSHLTEQDVQEVLEKGIHIKTLRSGGFFGLDTAIFQFQTHMVSAISNGALQRSDIGLTAKTCMHVLRLPFAIFQRIRNVISNSLMTRHHHTQEAVNIQVPRSPAFFFPYTFSQEKVEFLRQTFLFQSMREPNLQFLTSQMSCLRVPRHEYLFTPGEHATVLFLVKSGQLKLSTSYQMRCVNTAASDDTVELRDDRSFGSEPLASTPNRVIVETRHVELEILQPHDAIGLMEVCLIRVQFARQCVAMSDVTEVYTISAFALFSVLSCEQTASSHVVESLTRHHAWYKVRQYAALNHHQSSTISQKECSKLSLAVQQRGPIQCSRCGWAGHVSTSSICVRAESPRTILTRQVSTISIGGNNGGAGAKPVATVPVSPAVQLPLKTRSSRTQQRLWSLVVARSQEESESCNNSDSATMVLPITGSITQQKDAPIPRPPAKAALVHLNAIAHADSQLKVSLLRGLLPFLCMKKTGGELLASSSVDEEEHRANTASELERALKRLDKALVDEDKSTESDSGGPPVHPKLTTHFSPLIRPHTEGDFKRRGNAGSDDNHRANLRTATAQAVKRISTAVAATKANGLFEDWSTQPASSRSPRSRSKAYSREPLSLKKPETPINHKTQRRNAANL